MVRLHKQQPFKTWLFYSNILWHPGSRLAFESSDQGSISVISRSLLKCLCNTLLLSHIYLCLLSYAIISAAKTDNYVLADVVDQNPLNTPVFALGLLLPDTSAICKICLFTIAISI